MVQFGGRLPIKKANKLGILIVSLATIVGRTAKMSAKFLPSRLPTVARTISTFALFRVFNAATSGASGTRVEKTK